MKLRVHAITNGRFIKAGEEIDESLVTPFLRKYVIEERSSPPPEQAEQAEPIEPEEKAPTRRFKFKSKGR